MVNIIIISTSLTFIKSFFLKVAINPDLALGPQRDLPSFLTSSDPRCTEGEYVTEVG